MAKQIRPRISEEEYTLIKSIREQCKEQEIGLKHVRGGWLKNKTSSLHFKNPLFEDPDEPKQTTLDLSNILETIKPVDLPKVESVGFFDRLVFTDVHIGMDVNPTGFSLYGGKWDETEILARLRTMINWTLINRQSDVLYIDDLGDFMDGWDGYTTRKTHKLPQNLDNQSAFDLGVKFKMSLISELAPHYNKIVVNNICNDNHSGSFAYIVNEAVRQIAEATFGHRVEVNNRRKFLSHYSINSYVFIITHGKDQDHLKSGFKPVLDARGQERIENYINQHNLRGPGLTVEFSKGDSHQWVFDYGSSDNFAYCNYPAFSPSSDWVQTNFKKGRSGFILWNYGQGGTSIRPYLFDWKS